MFDGDLEVITNGYFTTVLNVRNPSKFNIFEYINICRSKIEGAVIHDKQIM